MKNFSLALLIILNGCMENNLQSQPFAGTFAGQQPGINSSVSLIVEGANISGSFELNGNPGNLTASFAKNNFEGTLYDIQMQKYYAFTGFLKQDSLFINIVFPELNNQVINLQMKRMVNKPVIENSKKPAGNNNPALLGLWRYTETFSSGSGDNYASFSTDYFMEFKEDGTVYSWTGKSAGGTNSLTIEGYPSGTIKGGWHTEEKTLYLTDLSNGQESSVLFYAEPNRMMLHNGGSEKKIMIRIAN